MASQREQQPTPERKPTLTIVGGTNNGGHNERRFHLREMVIPAGVAAGVNFVVLAVTAFLNTVR